VVTRKRIGHFLDGKKAVHWDRKDEGEKKGGNSENRVEAIGFNADSSVLSLQPKYCY
jgi:hypothetical protein